MSEHYYSRNPIVRSNVQTIKMILRGRAFEFNTDTGVFSKSGIDFGSRLLIESMHIPPAASVLDIGCGYGPIGLAAAALADKGKVTMLDINERAVELSRQNADRNCLNNVRVMQSDLYQAVADEKFDVILTNPPIRAGKIVVHRIFSEGYEHLSEGGRLWIVIQKKQGAASALERLESLFGQVTEVTKDKGYRIYCAVK